MQFLSSNFKPGDTDVYLYYYTAGDRSVRKDGAVFVNSIHRTTSNKLKLYVDKQTIEVLRKAYNQQSSTNKLDCVYWQQRLPYDKDLDKDNEELLSSTTEGMY